MSRRLLLLCVGLVVWVVGIGSEPCESGPRRVAPYPVWASPAEARVTVLRPPQAAYPTPVLDYRFLDGSGATVADSSGAGRTGTIYGDATWGSGGLTLPAYSYVLVPTTMGGLGVSSAGTIAVHGSISAGQPGGMVTQTTASMGYDLLLGYRTGVSLDRLFGVGIGDLGTTDAWSTAALTRIARWGGGTIGYRVGAGAEATVATSASHSNTAGAELRIGHGVSWTAPGTRVVRRVTIWSVRLTDAQIAAWRAEL